MRQRSVLFHISQLNVGGAERSSVRMINSLIQRNWKVTVVVEVGGGSLESGLAPEVELVAIRKKLRGVEFKAEKNFFRKIFLFPQVVFYLYDSIFSYLKKREFSRREYDAACILLMGTKPLFVCKYVKAIKKFHWIRNDLKQTPNAMKIQNSVNTWWCYIDKYICVSKTAERSLIDLCPQVEFKTHVVYNILNAGEMREKSLKKASISFSSETINLLSVCRLKDSAKAIFRMVEVCSILRDRGFEFKWYVIGDGPDRKALEVLIHKSHLEDCMILLGLKENPFPYYRMADVVAMLSYHEGLCGVINEAKVMKKAVVATKVSGVYEQLIDRQTGLIVDQEVSAIVEGLAELISDSELRTRLAESGYPTSILEDEHKITSLEALFDKEQ